MESEPEEEKGMSEDKPNDKMERKGHSPEELNRNVVIWAIVCLLVIVLVILLGIYS